MKEGDNQEVNANEENDINNNQDTDSENNEEFDINDNQDLDLESMTLEELRIIAKEKGIKSYASKKKDTLVNDIMELG